MPTPARSSPPGDSLTTTPVREAGVEIRGVGRTFGSGAGARAVLRDVDVTIPGGDIVAIIGASGSGKSTLLRLIAGLAESSEGTVEIDGTRVGAFDARCAVAFQEPRLLPWRTVAENVRLGVPRGTPRHVQQRIVDELLALVHLEAFAGHRPREISGGMAQRASLARALARRPRVLLLDEPFGALDALTRLRMHALVLELHAAVPTTIVFVTHDVDEALALADTVLVLGSPIDAPDAVVPVGRPDAGATIVARVRPEAPRPRSHGSDEFVILRNRLLDLLGVPDAASRGPLPAESTPPESTPTGAP